MRQDLNIPSGERHELCRGLHAEQNVLVQAALYGISTKGATLYCTHHPCIVCAKMIVNAGICQVITHEDYPDRLSREILDAAGIPVKRLSDGSV